jgi:tetratricopeptide (TPR) repeat protein
MPLFKFLVTLFALFSFAFGKAQALNPTVSNFLKGRTLFAEKKYAAAHAAFKNNIEKLEPNSTDKETCAYYLALSALKLNKKEAPSLLDDFEKKHPTSPLKNRLFLTVGNHYYNESKAATSLKWLQKVNPQHLTKKQKEAYHFKMGYALLSNKKFTEAKTYFLPLTHSKIYKTEANYYYGYLSYIQKDDDTAQKYFQKLTGNKRYQKEILYYQMNLLFRKKNYRAVVEKGLHLLTITSKNEISEISKIVGESYFYLENYSAAILHLKKYKGRKNQLSTNDRYFLGYAYYKQNDFKKAAQVFNKISKGKDTVGQNAYYHLAACYLALDKKSEALHAFKNASEANFDQKIKEKASFNYTKLSFDIGNPYLSTPKVLQNFIKQYPKGPNTLFVKKLVVNSYLRTKDYRGALLYYKNQRLPKDSVFYKINLLIALKYFDNKDYEATIAFFDTAILQLVTQSVQAKALYWKATAHYRLQQYQQALKEFKRFQRHPSSKSLPEHSVLPYSIAYTYFKIKEYDKARISFENHLQGTSTDKMKKNDSYLRLGDCHFASKKYWNAMEAYNKVIDKNEMDADYASYQKSMCYGFVNRVDQKITLLLDFAKQYPRSSYRDDALHALGTAYSNRKKYEKALRVFDQLSDNHKKSIHLPSAILKKGLIYFNTNKSEKSIKTYRELVKSYPRSKEAQQAIQNSRQVYVELDKVAEYAQWLQSIEHTDFTNTDLDNTMFEAAEIKYLGRKTSQAIISLNKYLSRFPNGLHSLKAHFYRAQAYFNRKENTKAGLDYGFIVSQKPNEHTEKSLSRLAQIYLEENSWSQAIPLLKRLEQEANAPENILFAQSNIMKDMYQNKNFSETFRYAETVLKNPKSSTQLKSDAYVYSARSAFKTKNFQKAENAYEKVTELATGILKAEALYHKAYFQHQAKDFEASNKTVQQLAADFASYKKWGIKGLLLMANNNEQLGDFFQATYILESLISNYGAYPDMVKEAQKLLKVIREKESVQSEATQN